MTSFRHSLTAGAFAALVACAACGGDSITAPTLAGPDQAAGRGRPDEPAGAATVEGFVLGNGVGGSSVAPAFGAGVVGVTVSVPGTPLRAGTDRDGRFRLQDVPPGDVMLQIQGAGVDATVILHDVRDGQTVRVVVTVRGGAATVEDDDRSAPGQDKVEIEGLVSAIDLATSTLEVDGATVGVSEATVIRHGAVPRPSVGLRRGPTLTDSRSCGL